MTCCCLLPPPRLYKSLDREGKAAGAREEPLRTCEGLERVARARQEELGSAREALATAAREQASAAACLEADCDSLRGAAYSGLQHLVLTPQVRATPARELCPNSQVRSRVLLFLFLLCASLAHANVTLAVSGPTQGSMSFVSATIIHGWKVVAQFWACSCWSHCKYLYP